jgi:hypothetical protein
MSAAPVKQVEWTGLSGSWLFRDPLVFFGLLAAAAVARAGLQASRVNVRLIVVALLGLQCLQQTSVVSQVFRGYWGDHTRLEFYRHQGHPTGVGKQMVEAANRYGRRLYLSARAQTYSRGYLSHVGVHAVTDYALLGLNPVTAWFKNVSMDRIHPSSGLMHGYIRGQQAVIENATLLDVLGINLVVTTTEEGLAPGGLIRVEQRRVSDVLGLEIFANPDAWPEAVLLSPDARDAALPVVEGCGHTGALCRDYTALARARLPQDVSLREVNDGYQLHVPPSDAPRLLFISAFYRPEWEATAADQVLTVDPIADAFIGVTVPPGVRDVQLAFRPRIRMALTWLSGVSLVVLLAALGTLTWRGRAGASGVKG